MTKKTSSGSSKKRDLRRLTAEDFYLLHLVEDPRLSPDGREAAYVVQRPDRKDNTYHRAIWLASTDDSAPPRAFTQGGKSGDWCPRWSPDGRQLAFVSARAGKPQIFLIPRDGGEARQLTRHPNGVASPVWSTDGKLIAFTARVRSEERQAEDESVEKERGPEQTTFEERMAQERSKEEELRRVDPRVVNRLLFRQGTEFWDGRYQHVYVQGLDEERAQRVTDGEVDHGVPSWTPDSRFIVTSANRTGDQDTEIRQDLYRFSLTGGPPVALTSDPDGDAMPVVTPDGNWVVYFSFQSKDPHHQRMLLRRVSIRGGKPQDLTAGFDRDPDPGAGELQIEPESGSVYFAAPDRGDVPLFRVPLTGGDVERLVAGRRSVEAFHVAGGRICLAISTPATPRDLFVTDLSGEQEVQLTELNAAVLAGKKLSLPEEVRFEGARRLPIQGWIMKPHGYRKGRKYPLIVQIHGGPHMMWGNTFWHEFQAMTTQGYMVFFCNPRGSDGYGSAFKGAIRRAWGDDDMQDILAGVDHVVARGDVDPDRLAVTGGSFGGFMTGWIVGHDHRFRAAVAQRGVYNFHTQYGNSDALQLVEWDFATLPWDDPDFMYQRSPIAYARQVDTPLLILHADQDYRVGIATADEFFVALKRLGKEVELVRYPREGHELSRTGEPEHRVDRIQRILEWFDRHLARKR